MPSLVFWFLVSNYIRIGRRLLVVGRRVAFVLGESREVFNLPLEGRKKNEAWHS